MVFNLDEKRIVSIVYENENGTLVTINFKDGNLSSVETVDELETVKGKGDEIKITRDLIDKFSDALGEDRDKRMDMLKWLCCTPKKLIEMDKNGQIDDLRKSGCKNIGPLSRLGHLNYLQKTMMEKSMEDKDCKAVRDIIKKDVNGDMDKMLQKHYKKVLGEQEDGKLCFKRVEELGSDGETTIVEDIVGPYWNTLSYDKTEDTVEVKETPVDTVKEKKLSDTLIDVSLTDSNEKGEQGKFAKLSFLCENNETKESFLDLDKLIDKLDGK